MKVPVIPIRAKLRPSFRLYSREKADQTAAATLTHDLRVQGYTAHTEALYLAFSMHSGGRASSGLSDKNEETCDRGDLLEAAPVPCSLTSAVSVFTRCKSSIWESSNSSFLSASSLSWRAASEDRAPHEEEQGSTHAELQTSSWGCQNGTTFPYNLPPTPPPAGSLVEQHRDETSSVQPCKRESNCEIELH